MTSPLNTDPTSTAPTNLNQGALGATGQTVPFDLGASNPAIQQWMNENVYSKPLTPGTSSVMAIEGDSNYGSPSSTNPNMSVMGGGYDTQGNPVDGNGNPINYGGSQGGTTPTTTPNPLSTYGTTSTTGTTPAPDIAGMSAGSSGSGSFAQGSALPNVTTVQKSQTAAPSFYTDYLNNLATQGKDAAENAQYVGATDLQNQAFNQVGQNVGNYQPALQSAINLAGSVGNSNLYQAVGDLGEANIRRNLAPQATAGLVGSGQFGSSRGASALGDTIANAELGITAQQQAALQQDYANRLNASNALGNLAGQTQALGLGDVNALATMGGQQQTIAQNEQLFPMQQLTNESQLLKGYTIPTSTTQATTAPGQQGQFAMSPLAQIMSIGTLLGAVNQTPANGGNTAMQNLMTAISNGGSSLSKYLTSFGSTPATPTTVNDTTGMQLAPNQNPSSYAGYVQGSDGNLYIDPTYGTGTTSSGGSLVDTNTNSLGT